MLYSRRLRSADERLLIGDEYRTHDREPVLFREIRRSNSTFNSTFGLSRSTEFLMRRDARYRLSGALAVGFCGFSPFAAVASGTFAV